MKSRLTKHVGEMLEPSAYDGENRSGITPYNDYVLVLPDKAKEKIGSIILVDGTKDTAQLASETGVIVAIGEGAFVWSRDRMRPWTGQKPQIGDRVVYQRYAGQLSIGSDEQEYRLMGDKEIAATQAVAPTVTPEAVAAAAESGATISMGDPLGR